MSDAASPAGSPAAEPTEHRDEDQVNETHQDDGSNYGGNDDDNDGGNDKDSDVLSEIDENEFGDDYGSRPVDIDENVAMKLKARRKTTTETTKKPKEGRRPKKRSRGDDDVDAADDDGERRPRKVRAEGERRARKEAEDQKAQQEENLTPDERRRRALERAIDAAVKNPTKRRRKKDDIDLEEETDEQIANLKVAMEKACVADNEAREQKQPAVHKLKLLPQVTAILNRTAIQDSVLDPEINFLQSVRYFLEPLNDGSLPAYNIQRAIMSALMKLPINKDVLLSSGIGKVVVYYNKSKSPSADIKRDAERLLGEWSRLILKRTDDYKKRHIEMREIDVGAVKLGQREGGSSQVTLTQRPAGKSRYEIERERALAPEVRNNNRARPVGLPASYTIAPKSTYIPGQAPTDHRPIGHSGHEAFRRMTQKGKGKR
ncbi:Transcription factor iws1 [Neurospora sp. IMI 360204]|nr:Transcription factor iws1 [Neurospora sp. IMI 360204]